MFSYQTRPPLLRAIQRFHELQDHAIGNLKFWGRLHIDVLLQFTVEVSGLNIHLVNFQVEFCSECKTLWALSNVR